MNALNQYTDLYEANRAAVDAGSAPVLNRLRPEALDALKRIGRCPTSRTRGSRKPRSTICSHLTSG